ncbi:MAG: hypothetical protein ACKVS6_03500 [Planctomycetota bacterium]
MRIANFTKSALHLLIIVFMTSAAAVAQAGKSADPEAPFDAPDRRDATRPAKIAIFRSAGFPTVDAPEIEAATLDEALKGLPVEVLVSAEDVKNRLKVKDFDVFVLPYGSAFPLGAWNQIRAFLENGGGFVVLGGAPLHQPVRWLQEKGQTPQNPGSQPSSDAHKKDESTKKELRGVWELGTRQPTFARELLIGPAEPIEIKTGFISSVPGSGWTGPALAKMNVVYSLTIRLTTKKDFDKEDGTSGPRDAVVRPIFHILSERDAVPYACPLLEIDRLRGSDAGARWVFAPSDAKLEAATIRNCIERALAGSVELDARPVDACVDPGGSASIRIQLRKPFIRKGEVVPSSVRVRASGPNGTKTWSAVGEVALVGEGQNRVGQIQFLDLDKPGIYNVEVEVINFAGQPSIQKTGFWVRDEKLLRSGPKITVSTDWLRKDNVVFPIVGTTYMASDVHRKFLFEPNPYLWDRDFAEMKRFGVNFVRTGFWTGWQRAMLDSGAIDEHVLRALDAYVLTAARHGIIVCFNFFAFQPTMHGGTNPYLDPRALEGQKALLTSVAARYRGVNWIHYDLINEPSYCPPENLWSNRPSGDDHEKRAWSDWVRAKHGDDSVALRDRWREPWGDILALPKPEDLNYQMIREARRPRKAADFHKFSNDMVSRWAGELRATLRAAGGDVLVTLGQDEGGTWLRPSQQVYAESVDYTAVHTWWNNDDLLWDGVLTKVPEKPNVIQETGLMRLETIDGFPWRSPEAAAQLLERKFAFSFAARGAGSIQWAWNINPYMPVENEAVIGIWRPDGTAKPELRVMQQFGAFFTKAAPHLDDFLPNSVIVILPHSRLFAGRQHGLDATKQVIRTLAEEFGIVPTAISEMRMDPERFSTAKLTIVPSPEMLEDEAAATLAGLMKAGRKILVTGWLQGNPYGQKSAAHEILGICDEGKPVALHEMNNWQGYESLPFLTFEDNRGQWLRRSNKTEPINFKNPIWHEPLPVEFARERQALRQLLHAAIVNAGIEIPSLSNIGVSTRVLETQKVSLIMCVNETSAGAEKLVKTAGRDVKVNVAAGRSRFLLIDKQSGSVLADSENP